MAPFSFTMGQVPKLRGLYVNDKLGRLLQIQDDLFAVNWRKESSTATYPRYEALRDAFVSELDNYLDFLRQ
jgi:hypothetical protein